MEERPLSEVNKEFDRVYKLYSKSIYKYCLAKLSDEVDAETCLHDAFTVYFVNYKNGVDILSPRAYLYSCARNFVSRVYRERKRLENKNLSLFEAGISEDMLPTINNPYEAIEDPEEPDKDEYLQVCFSQMTEQEVELFKARWEDGYSIKDVTGLFGITEGNAKVRSKRIRDKMKVMISEEYERRRP